MINDIISTLLLFITTPFNHPDMIWIAFPLIITLLLMELYFGRYKKEHFGGSSTVSNSLVYVFVGLDLLRKLSTSDEYVITNPKVLLAAGILAIGLIFTYITFYHDLESIITKLTSFLIVNTSTYLVIVAIYGEIPVNVIFLASSLVFICAVWGIFQLIHLIEPHKSV